MTCTTNPNFCKVGFLRGIDGLEEEILLLAERKLKCFASCRSAWLGLAWLGTAQQRLGGTAAVAAVPLCRKDALQQSDLVHDLPDLSRIRIHHRGGECRARRLCGTARDGARTVLRQTSGL